MSGEGAASARKVSRDTGISQETLSRWLREARSLPVVAGAKRSSKVWSPADKIRVLHEASTLDHLWEDEDDDTPEGSDS